MNDTTHETPRQGGYWCKSIVPERVDDNSRFDGFKAAEAGTHRDETRNALWLKGWDAFDEIKRADVEAMVAADEVGDCGPVEPDYHAVHGPALGASEDPDRVILAGGLDRPVTF